ncbi:MAG: hypothetical protein V7642_3319 [Burkholderiales bacterium]
MRLGIAKDRSCRNENLEEKQIDRSELSSGKAISLVMLLITLKEYIMGKYFIAWLLGVPAIVLVLFYLFFH